MKTILILIIVLFGVINSRAQSERFIEREFDTCHSLGVYAGEWQYSNGSDTIRIYLRFHRDTSSSFKYVSDKLFGWHEYKQGNTIVESNYQKRFMNLSSNADIDDTNDRSVSLKLKECNASYDTLTGLIFDYSQAKEMHVVTAVLSSNRTVMTWNQKHREGFGFRTGATGMTLPKQFLLIKQ